MSVHSPEEIAALLTPMRRELRAHCYRLVGSIHDAEELVQEASLRAWKAGGGFDGRSSFRTWVYAICTNVCLDALRERKRRVLPQSLRPAAQEDESMPPPLLERAWLEPFPDDEPLDPQRTPDQLVAARQSVALAFVAALQVLPPRQRAALLLRDVVGLEAVETAATLGMTVAAVNSAVQRARSTLKDQPQPPPEAPVDEELLERYVSAWHSANVHHLISVIREDATLSMPPLLLWYHGRDAILTSLARMVFPAGAPPAWKLLRTHANGKPAFGAYERGADGVFHARGIQTLQFSEGTVSGIVAFLDPSLLPVFSLPPTWAGG